MFVSRGFIKQRRTKEMCFLFHNKEDNIASCRIGTVAMFKKGQIACVGFPCMVCRLGTSMFRDDGVRALRKTCVASCYFVLFNLNPALHIFVCSTAISTWLFGMVVLLSSLTLSVCAMQTAQCERHTMKNSSFQEIVAYCRESLRVVTPQERNIEEHSPRGQLRFTTFPGGHIRFTVHLSPDRRHLSECSSHLPLFLDGAAEQRLLDLDELPFQPLSQRDRLHRAACLSCKCDE